MKREIKFRAWHKGYKETARTLEIKPQMLFDENPGECLAFLNQGQPVQVMQFTGFKDIKGVEIYEGDILKRANNKLVEVYWRDEYGCFDGAYINFEGSNILSTYVSDSEVIGNIYQNTELLP